MGEFMLLTMCQVNLYLKTHKHIEETKKLNKKLNADLRKK